MLSTQWTQGTEKWLILIWIIQMIYMIHNNCSCTSGLMPYFIIKTISSAPQGAIQLTLTLLWPNKLFPLPLLKTNHWNHSQGIISLGSSLTDKCFLKLLFQTTISLIDILQRDPIQDLIQHQIWSLTDHYSPISWQVSNNFLQIYKSNYKYA